MDNLLARSALHAPHGASRIDSLTRLCGRVNATQPDGCAPTQATRNAPGPGPGRNVERRFESRARSSKPTAPPLSTNAALGWLVRPHHHLRPPRESLGGSGLHGVKTTVLGEGRTTMGWCCLNVHHDSTDVARRDRHRSWAYTELMGGERVA